MNVQFVGEAEAQAAARAIREGALGGGGLYGRQVEERLRALTHSPYVYFVTSGTHALELALIRSFEKLTGEGVTFVGSDLVRILEEVLPAKLGGRATDYQLVEEDDPNGLRSLTLLVDPRLGKIDEAEAVRTLLEGLARGGDRNRVWSRIWMQAGTIRVRRESPVATSRGKILQFHLRQART